MRALDTSRIIRKYDFLLNNGRESLFPAIFTLRFPIIICGNNQRCSIAGFTESILAIRQACLFFIYDDPMRSGRILNAIIVRDHAEYQRNDDKNFSCDIVIIIIIKKNRYSRIARIECKNKKYNENPPAAMLKIQI